ncbi:hypothetical protein CLV40_12334 [Actinokineospora auranticolor]|uniref:Uncharacterized protein n=1 Tax=Actinokineospora auranticolor TaxID=155976 RepID=A0A2S6GFB9_9PSEU|nr:hypothetical protein CLV40_12334 [Actinokineospora auranticolor]
MATGRPWRGTNRGLVVAGGDGPVLCEQVDAAFHGVVLLVCLGVERGRAPTGGAFVLAVGGLVAGLGDRGPDAPSAQAGPVRERGAGLDREHPTGPGPGTAAAGTGHPDALDHSSELRAVTAAPGGEQQRQRRAPLLTRQVRRAGPPATRPAQRMTVRFAPTCRGVEWLDPQSPLFLAPGAMVMDTGDRARTVTTTPVTRSPVVQARSVAYPSTEDLSTSRTPPHPRSTSETRPRSCPVDLHRR